LLPVEILITEHRLIERFVKLVEKEKEKIVKTQSIQPNFMVVAVDFFRTYADRFHHGKEEGVLFQELSQKKLSDVDKKMMLDLSMEHAYARKTVNNLEKLKESYLAGEADALKEILQLLNTLVELYPKHIEKEDKHFFYPSMEYFTQTEQRAMLTKFIDFNRNFTDKKYQQIVWALETQPTSTQ
jgi:hemerythrin-like domain-containing protein